MTAMGIPNKHSRLIAVTTKGSPSTRWWSNAGTIERLLAMGPSRLPNGSVKDPFVVFDTYDWRSVIENGIFKEGKHPWHLGRFPKRTQAAVVVHCHFTLLVMGLCTAFRL